MNCCTEYGDCTQGRDCPCRTGTVLPHQAAHARKVAVAQGVAPIKSSRPKWMDGKGAAVPPEAGNFQIIDLGPDDDGQPLTHDESMALVRTLMAWLVGVVVVVAAAAFASSYGTERFAEALWQFLGGLS